jgi:F-type H+-transporting ATPase subunit a
VDIFYGLELFVGLVQAFVFAMLTLVFAQTAVAGHGDGHEGEHGEAEHA